MILADTSIWVDHFRRRDAALSNLLEANEVLTHSFVIGELALGRLRDRETILHTLQNLPRALGASDAEVLAFIESNKLFGLGIGYVDAHLLAATQLSPDALLWTRDKRLEEAAHRLSLSADLG